MCLIGCDRNLTIFVRRANSWTGGDWGIPIRRAFYTPYLGDVKKFEGGPWFLIRGLRLRG
jgi:hypothetical protein